MIECEECGTKLGILEGYRHPTMGKKHLLCSSCFDTVSESLEKWMEFVISNSFNLEISKRNLQIDRKNIPASLIQKQKIFDNLLTRSEIHVR